MCAHDTSTEVTAFRAAEKFYQKHVDQMPRYRGGRPHGTRKLERPTDLSSLLDVDNPLHLHSRADEVTPHPAALSAGELYSFRRHPGLYLVRRALSAQEQRRLVQDCFTLLPEPPAHTNFTRTHGGLPGLWEAAQAGLHLRCKRPHAGTAPSAPAVTAHSQQPSTGAKQATEGHPAAQTTGCVCSSSNEPCSGCSGGEGGVWSRACDAQGPPAGKLLRKLRWASIGLPYDWTHRQYLTDTDHVALPQYLTHTAAHLASAAHAANAVLEHQAGAAAAGDGASISSAAAGGGGGGGGGGNTPLPRPHASPLDAASPASHNFMHRANQEGALNTVTTSAQPPAPSPQQPPSSQQTQQAQQASLAQQPPSVQHAQQPALVRLPSTAASPQPPPSPQHAQHAFLPDAALVNYYYEGDTLGGHLDDVEADQGQPLVGLSLGCPGVVLVGGRTKDVPPTAVLVRGGDAVILSGPARRCYHGVPRILPDWHDPPEAAAEPGPGHAPQEQQDLGPDELPQDDAFTAHMQRCRINVSVRCTGAGRPGT